MPIIHTALHSEAKIFKEEFKLQKIKSYRKIEIFSRDNLVLVVSGIGKVSTSVGIALASELFPKSKDFYLNFGIAGSSKKEIALGELRIADKVIDLSTDRSYFPDCILQTEIASASLGSSDLPVANISDENFPLTSIGLNSKIKYIKPKDNSLDLYDMEASSFFQSAIYFTESHRIHSLKIISDHLEGIFCKASDVENWAAFQKENVFTFLLDHQKYFSEGMNSESSNHKDESMESQSKLILGEIQSNLRLTSSQMSQLNKAFESWKIHSNIKDETWKKFLYSESDRINKEEGKNRLKQIISYFYNRDIV